MSTEAAQLPKCCGTCEFWAPDTLLGDRKVSVWGYCQIGFPKNLTIPNRMTTDLQVCTGWEVKKPPEDNQVPPAA